MAGPAFVGAPIGVSSLFPRNSKSSRAVCRPASFARPRIVQRSEVKMGLFGLGLPELAVIAGVGIFIFGPKKISEMGKDLGSVAGSVKKATGEFQEAMEESLKEADAELEKKRKEKEAAKNQTVDAAVSSVENAEIAETK